ncbi:AbrB family transcriptional regulator [Octadecabacter sp. G9-8]|uniref:AbrB family transcriptional regulator n=1 Tax=Octadecabacter dasysiphoniae TaxID=2909341 RepID=A0ABS9CTD6_9RHOB|nr:AbrB family transcriptional regulator [Octadecabacter dasysiphoniae]MCF2870037.1 AbrB family transcriptional regulator [Octadecabacter dasysiphoniae]
MALAVTLLISIVGVGVFYALALPLPWLLGPLLGCLIAALFGVRLQGAPRSSQVMRTILGVAVGATITPALFAQLGTLIWTLALVPLLVICVGAVGYPLFRKGFGFDHPTAFYASMPGGLQDMLLFGEEAGGDVRALSLIHATRVLIVVMVLPFVFAFFYNVDLNQPAGEPFTSVPPIELLILAVAGIAGWRIAKFVGLFGASLLGPLFLTAALSLGDVIHHRPPAEAIAAAQFFIGFTIGVKYTGISWRELRIDVTAGVIFSVLSLIVGAIFAAVIIRLGWLPFTEAVLAFSPGGQAEMAIVALVAGADAAVVVAHHLVRIVFVIMGAPLVDRWFGST